MKNFFCPSLHHWGIRCNVNFTVSKFSFEKILYIWLEWRRWCFGDFSENYIYVLYKHTQRGFVKLLKGALKNTDWDAKNKNKIKKWEIISNSNKKNNNNNTNVLWKHAGRCFPKISERQRESSIFRHKINNLLVKSQRFGKLSVT